MSVTTKRGSPQAQRLDRSERELGFRCGRINYAVSPEFPSKPDEGAAWQFMGSLG